MKKLTLLMLVLAGVLSGCVAYDPHPGSRDGSYRDRDRDGSYRDRDRDGVPNRMDRDRDGDGILNRNDSRPNTPSRY